MKDLSDRLEWLAQKAGGFRELDRRAGLTEGHTNTVCKRARAKERGDVARGEFGLSAAAAVARAMGVSLEWLAAGGDDDGQRAAPEPTATGERAKSAATVLGFGQKAIDAGLADAKADDDAWAILVRIELADRNAKASPANQTESSLRAVAETKIEGQAGARKAIERIAADGSSSAKKGTK